MSYTPKIDQLLKVATELGFTEQDFADLALAAADQSGATTAEQARVAAALGIQTWEAREQPSCCPSCGLWTCGRTECGGQPR